MLSTDLYDRDLQLIVQNTRAASARCDGVALDRIIKHFVRLIDYAEAHGLTLTSHNGRFYFKRNGYSPHFRYIETHEDVGYQDCPRCGHAWNAHSVWIARGERVCEEVRPSMTRTPPIAFVRPEDLNTAVDELVRDCYHLFLDGQWIAVFDDPGELLRTYRDYGRLGQACTVVAAGEIVLFTARSASSSALSSGERMMQKLHLDEERHR